MSDSALGDSCAEADSEHINVKYKSNVYSQPNTEYKAEDHMGSLDEKKTEVKKCHVSALLRCGYFVDVKIVPAVKVWKLRSCEVYTPVFQM